MKSLLKSLLAGLLAVTLTGPVAVAQERAALSEEELHQMLAPIALYPDSLLSQILMAATYPLEIVQAARWSRANSQLKGDDAVKAVDGMEWDPSVKSLVAFPQVLQRMDERLDWTQRLGEAFLVQEPHVLDAIQSLRQRAEAAGSLKSGDQMRVTRQDEAILIEPAHPESVYVPYYDPAVVYGAWGYPAYPPVYWAPWPGYYAAPAFWPGFFWGPAIVVSTGFFFGHADFHHHHVKVHHKHGHHAHGKHHRVHDKPVPWKHNPTHRKGVPYRHADLNKKYAGRPGAHRGDSQRDYRGPKSAPIARDGDGGLPAGNRDWRRDNRGDSLTDRGRRPGAGGGNPSDGRGKSNYDSGSRRPGTAGPGAPAGERRSDAGRDNPHVQGRSPASQPTAGAPAARQPRREDSNNVVRFPGRPQSQPAPSATRQAQRPDSNGGNVHRFQGHIPAQRPAPAAPATRQTQRPDSNGANVHRFQGRVPAQRPAPAPPTVRQNPQRPAAAAPPRTIRQAAPQARSRPPVSNQGNRVQAGRPMMAPRMSSPVPQARGGNGAPRTGNGHFRRSHRGGRG